MLFESMTEDDIETRNKALLGLYEDGFIEMAAEKVFGELEVQEVRITQRGQKLLAEAENVMIENGRHLEEEEKTEKKYEKEGSF
ncbi:MAG: hypothetical protein E7260_12170 [Lachnospiraceae bacterium]|nr:hypothetical protein [Lachnospiraceae bacterium]